jgi:hypothetical protein
VIVIFEMLHKRYMRGTVIHQSNFLVKGRIQIVFQWLRSTNKGPFISRGLSLQQNNDRVGLGERVLVHKIKALQT